jgi:hypothetical protein
MIQNLNSLIDHPAQVLIQYFDIDRETVLHEKRYSGIVVGVDELEGVTIKTENPDSPFFMIPPAIEAWSKDVDDHYNVHWFVFRKQEKRTDGEHEWWDWQPKR